MADVSAIKLPNNTTYNIKAGVIPYGEVDSTSTSTAYTATVSGVNELKDGTIVLLKNGVVTSASGFTININSLGAKPCYNNMTTGNDITPTAPTRDTTIFNINYTMLFIYSEDIVDGGGWICYRGYDANTNTIGYQLRGNNGTRPAADKGYRYRIWLSSLDNQSWVPINKSTATDTTTAKTLNTRVIDPFGEIVYYSYNGTTNAAANLTATTIWQQYTFDIRYSYVKTLTAWDPVYIKCTPQNTGGAIMNDIVQTLPNSNDGYIYIYLGIAYSTTSVELRFYHPVYYHDGTGIKLWTGKKIPTKTSDLTNDGDGSSAFATMADIGSLGGGTITGVKTTAGAHSTIDVSSGAANFNVPTKTSHLTNDSGFITSVPVTSVNSKTGAVSLSASDVGAQSTLVSGTNIKTINSQSILGSGNLDISDLFIVEAEVTPFINIQNAILDGKHVVMPYFEEDYTSFSYPSECVKNDFITFTTAFAGDGAAAGINFATVDVNNTWTYGGTEIRTIPLNIVEKITTTAGAHSTITNKSGAVSFNVPTKTSHLTNDSGFITAADVPESINAYTGTISAVGTSATGGTSNEFARGDHVHNITDTVIKSALGTGTGTTKFLREDGSWAIPAYIANTDEKLGVAEVTSNTLYYPIVGINTAAATRQYDTTGFSYRGIKGTTGSVGTATIALGNGIASGTENNKKGKLRLYGPDDNWVELEYAGTNYNRIISFPDKAGTVALTSDIPTISYPVTSVNSKTGAVSLTASDVGAVPTTRTINGKALSSNITLDISDIGMAPLIGTTGTVTAQQVMTALGEGRDICITATASLAGVPLELKFTAFNRATDTAYGGAAIDVVVSQTIAVYNNNYYLFELVGGTSNTESSWTVYNTTLAQASDIPTDVSDLNNDVGYISSYEETDPVFTASAAHGISSSDISNWNGKQAALVSGTNIKTINNQSLLGSGNITIEDGSDIKLYYEPGDSITYGEYESGLVITGFVTSSKTEDHYTIPLSKPCTASTVTITNFGIICRQDASYVHGTGATTYKTPSYTAALTGQDSDGAYTSIKIVCTWSNTSNVVNNAPMAANIRGVFTFS